MRSMNLDTVGDTAKRLLKKVKYRNMLIKVAETSPGGWGTVTEYERPSLGSDSEDERKLKVAESKAIKKLKTVQSSKPNVSSSSRYSNFMFPTVGERSFPAANLQPPRATFPGNQASRFPDPVFQPFRGKPATPRDICFGCGRTGHFRRDCVWLRGSDSGFRQPGVKGEFAGAATSSANK